MSAYEREKRLHQQTRDALDAAVEENAELRRTAHDGTEAMRRILWRSRANACNELLQRYHEHGHSVELVAAVSEFYQAGAYGPEEYPDEAESAK